MSGGKQWEMQREERVVDCRRAGLEGFTMARMESVSSDLVLFCGVVSFGVAMWEGGGGEERGRP